MANIGFHINYNKTDKNSFAPIRAKIWVDSKGPTKTLPFKTKVTKNIQGKYECKKWNTNTQRFYNFRETDKYYNDYSEINSFLDDYEYQAKQLFKDCLKNKVKLTESVVRKFFDGDEINLNPERKSFWTIYDDYIKDGKSTKAPNTVRTHKSNKKKLECFEEDMNYKMSFEAVNLQFFDKLKEYVLLDKEHGWNYFSAIIRRLKAYMTWSFDRKLHNNREYKKFTATEKKITVVRLTANELAKLMYFEFENKSYAKARDFFCFACLTGARYSDLNRLTKDNLHGKTIVFTPHKTKNPRPIELHLNELHFEIMDRYKEQHRLLPRYENQSFNRILKKACEKAELDTITEVLNFKEKEPPTEKKPKHELITSHTGRKTFICMRHEEGTDILTIMSYTGIEKMETIRTYLEVSESVKKKGMDRMKESILNAKAKAEADTKKT